MEHIQNWPQAFAVASVAISVAIAVVGFMFSLSKF